MERVREKKTTLRKEEMATKRKGAKGRIGDRVGKGKGAAVHTERYTKKADREGWKKKKSHQQI